MRSETCEIVHRSQLVFSASQSEASRLAEEVGKREQPVTVLFNNAGSVRSAAIC